MAVHTIVFAKHHSIFLFFGGTYFCVGDFYRPECTPKAGAVEKPLAISLTLVD
jgi:hypothetical protein